MTAETRPHRQRGALPCGHAIRRLVITVVAWLAVITVAAGGTTAAPERDPHRPQPVASGTATPVPLATPRPAPLIAGLTGAASTAAQVAATVPVEGDGFWFMPGVNATRVGRVVRMAPDTPQAVRLLVTQAVREINDVSGVGLVVGSDTTAPPSADEIVIRVPDQTVCGPLASGCTSNAIASDRGFGVVTNALVELQRDLLGSGYEMAVLLHELGHAMGLGHFNEPYGTLMQVMWSFVTPDMTSYRSGDRNGLRALAAAFANPRVTGTIDVVRQEPDGIRVTGWVVDRDDPALPLDVAFTLNGFTGATGIADQYRPDIETVIPGAGPDHGIDLVAPAPEFEGQVTACVDAIGNRGQRVRVGCRPLTIAHRPVGAIDRATVTGPGAVRVAGWAIDPDTAASIGVHIDVNGRRVTTVTADRRRSDVALAKPGYGTDHGFVVDLTDLPGGRHTVCATGVDATGDPDRLVGCISVTTPGGNPFGRIDRLAPSWLFPLEVRGWAIDPDTADPIAVHLYVNGVFAGATLAQRSRPDLAVAFPGYGDRHGFHLRLPDLPAGTRTACVYAINVGSGDRNPGLGCVDYTVPGGDPFGVVDAVAIRDGAVVVAGWAIDPDTRDPIAVHVYANGRFVAAALAWRSRPDVSRNWPGYGDRHGFNIRLEGLARDTLRVCVFAINVGSGSLNTGLGCRTVRR